MLVLSCGPTETCYPKQFVRLTVPPCSEETIIDVEVVRWLGVRASVGFTAPPHVVIVRSEIVERGEHIE